MGGEGCDRMTSALKPGAIATDIHMIATKMRDRLRAHGFNPVGTVVEFPPDVWDYFFPEAKQVFLHDIKFRRGHPR